MLTVVLVQVLKCVCLRKFISFLKPDTIVSRRKEFLMADGNEELPRRKMKAVRYVKMGLL